MSNYVDGNLSTTNKINNKCDGQEGKNWTKNDKKMSLYSRNSRAVILK